jgi:hypothetical protein
LATLRLDGSPRVSGIEVQIADGEAVIGMMPGSAKLRDVRRDRRVALHALSDDPPEGDASAWAGDVKIGGSVVELPDAKHPGEPTNRFRIDIDDVVLTRIGEPADHLVITWWRAGEGLTTRRRD